LDGAVRDVAKIVSDDKLIDFLRIDPAVNNCFVRCNSSDVRYIKIIGRVASFFDAGDLLEFFHYFL
jgi:hypothetical protein